VRISLNFRFCRQPLWLCTALILLTKWGYYSVRADDTWLYAVQISAVVQTDPAQITLSWEQDQFGADNYIIFRKFKTDASWGAGILLPGTATNFTDIDVTVGTAYEYQIIKHATLGYTGYGYIYVGVNAPLIEDRGTVVLLVGADTISLASELERLQRDLVGDGWSVIRHDVSPSDDPASVRALVQNDFQADPGHLQAVFLLGHVPVVMSGNINYDSHGARALPADGFYGDMTGDWRLGQNPTNRPSYFPAPIDLMVGRVDFFDMPGNGAAVPWPNETELMRRYLNKDHAWRHKQVTAPRRALMANRVGDFDGQAFAATGYRNFQPFVGAGNIVEADISDTAPPDQRWISLASKTAWLWSYGCGGGRDVAISDLGTNGPYNDVWSTDVVGQDAKVVFSMFFGSHFGDWTHTDNFLRSMLATPSLGLTACIAGLPHWFCHHMALGEPIGYAARLTMNNTSLYQNQSNALRRAVFINLLGDPTLRMEATAPPSNLSASGSNGLLLLTWSPSPDPVVGYHIYRSPNANGPFLRLTSSPVGSNSYTDSEAASGTYFYMVRAVALVTNPSGSYFNASQGLFVQGEITKPIGPVPITLNVALEGGLLKMDWLSESGAVFHVEAKIPSVSATWADISGLITATSSNMSFVDTNSAQYPSRLYRVVSH
jgi:hypothetical protein